MLLHLHHLLLLHHVHVVLLGHEWILHLTHHGAASVHAWVAEWVLAAHVHLSLILVLLLHLRCHTWVLLTWVVVELAKHLELITARSWLSWSERLARAGKDVV